MVLFFPKVRIARGIINAIRLGLMLGNHSS